MKYKQRLGALCLLPLMSSVVMAQQQASPCAGLWGFAAGHCSANEQKLQAKQQALDEQRQQLQMQQDEQRDRQARIQQQELESERKRHELLQKELDQAKSPEQPDPSNTPEFRSWLADNQWFEKDKARREFAVLYAKQLRQDRPSLQGRAFFDAVTAKVNDTFGASR